MFKKIFLHVLYVMAACIALCPLQAQIDGNSCEDSCCKSCPETCNRFWLTADYLYYQIQSAKKVIPLVIEQPVRDGPFDIVLGDKKMGNDWHSGARITLGYLFNECLGLGVEAEYFFLAQRSKHDEVKSNKNGSPRLRVPYFNVTTNRPDSSALSTPGIFHGSADLKVTDKMQGAELNIVKDICFRNTSGFRVLAGFRYWNFTDHLKFSVNSPLVVVPTVYKYHDTFRTQNNFYGGQIGASYARDFCRFCFDLKAKIALGAMCQKSIIDGRFQTNEFDGSVQSFEGGFFALPTNIGSRSKTRFSVIPEINLNIGYRITDRFCVRVGYSAFYVTEVLRASEQMNGHLNPSQSANIDFTPDPKLVGKPSPKGKIKSTGLWAQGVNAGFEYTF